MFNYKISPASQTIFLAVLQARIFLIKIKISRVLNFHFSGFSGESVCLQCGQDGMDWSLVMAQKVKKRTCLQIIPVLQCSQRHHT
jgi:hypothetical protein